MTRSTRTRSARRQPAPAPQPVDPTVGMDAALLDLAVRLGMGATEIAKLRADAARGGLDEADLAAYLTNALGAMAGYFEESLRRRDAERSGAFQGACATLGIEAATATPEAVRRAYRRRVAAGKLHPDQGGDAYAFQRVTAARDVALATAPAA